MSITIKIVDFVDSWPEMEPLYRRQYNEVERLSDGKWPFSCVTPDFETIAHLTDHDQFYLFVAYDDEAPVGYIGFTVSQNYFYGTWQAQETFIYTEPAYRGQGIAGKLLDTAIEKFKDRVDLFICSVKPFHGGPQLVVSRGFEMAEMLYFKVV